MIRYKNNNICVLCENGWTLEIKDKENLINEDITQELKKIDMVIYFNDTSGEHWIFDFKIKNIWLESLKIDRIEKHIILKAWN